MWLKSKNLFSSTNIGDPDAIRTHDLQIRNLLLYPAELRDLMVCGSVNDDGNEGAMMRPLALLVLGWGLAACQPVSPLPDMEAGELGRVVRVIDGDALALNTGQSVRLVGIEAPALRPRGREPDSYAVEASRTMEDMALGREVRLYYPGLTRDRYDRALAHVITRDGAGPELWLNMELIKRGAGAVLPRYGSLQRRAAGGRRGRAARQDRAVGQGGVSHPPCR